MKKVISFLTTILISTSLSSTIISCKHTTKKTAELLIKKVDALLDDLNFYN